MRLFDAKSEEVLVRLGATDSVAACDLLAEFPAAFLGGVGIAVASAVTSTSVTPFAAGAIEGALLIVWIALFGWRAYFTNRNWICSISQDTLLVRLFRNLGRKRIAGVEPDILAFETSEVESLSAQTVEIIWSSIRRTTIRCLCVEAKAGARKAISEFEGFSNYGCDTPKHRVAVCHDGCVLIEWTYKHPGLDDFLRQVSRKNLPISIDNTKHVSLDLRGFVSLLKHDQRDLLLRLKQFGFGAACVMMLKRRMRMSGAEAVQLMDGL